MRIGSSEGMRLDPMAEVHATQRATDQVGRSNLTLTMAALFGSVPRGAPGPRKGACAVDHDPVFVIAGLR